MLPFRSGRAGFPGASSAFLLFAFLSCAALAAEKIAQPEEKATSPAKSPAKTVTGLTSVPLAVGHDAKDLVLPIFDRLGHMCGRLEAGVARRLDDNHVEFQAVKFTTFTPENTTDLEISVINSIFDLKTQLINSSQRSTVKRADFDISGDKMQFDMVARKGTLTGHVKMVVTGKARTPGHEGE